MDMKTITNIFIAGSLALAAMLFAACKQEESPVAKAVLASEQYIEFEAEGASPVAVTVFSDGNWVADYPSWITLSQTSGQSGTTEGVTITAADNKDAEGVLLPRRDTVKFHGNRLISYSYVIVYQKGDKYRGLAEKSLAEVAALPDGEFCSVNGPQVVAMDGNGFIVSDGTALMYIKSKQSVKVGDVLSFKGSKSTSSDLATLTDLEDFKVVSNKEVTYPAATDITSTFASYKFKAYDYVTVSGVFNGSKLTIDGVDNAIIANASADKALGNLAGHKATLTGYIIANSSTNFTMVVTGAEDNGLLVVFNLPFFDDFEWLEPWTTASSAGDAVGTSNPSSTAPNIFTAATCEGVVDELANRGYSVVNGWKGQDFVDISLDPSKNQSIVYLQTNYLKFGKTSYNAGIILPAFNGLGSKTADVELSFDWCWQLTGKMKPDIMTITVELQGTGTLEQSVFESSQPTEGDLSNFAWQNVKVAIKGIDAGTRIIIRPTNADPSISSTRDQNRWYLDNIGVAVNGDITPGGGDDVPSNISANWFFDVDHYDTYGPTFGGSTKDADGAYVGTNDKNAGDGGKYIDSDEKNAVLTYVNIDKTSIDTAGKSVRNVGKTGEPYCVGAWPGDYWLYSMTLPGSYPAGSKIHFAGTMKTSATGLKHWKVEVLDGTEWVAPIDLQTATVDNDNVQYNVEMVGTDLNRVEFTYTTTKAVSSVQVRVTAMSSRQANDAKTLTAPNGGTIRFCGGEGNNSILEISK